MSELPFKELESLSFLRELPNPKPQPTDKRRYGELASLYTSFSRDFAAHLLTEFSTRGQMEILDPFGGMGTVGEAGRSLPLEITLNDINPFASLSGLFRTSNHKALYRSIDRINKIDFSRFSGTERNIFLDAIRDITGSTDPVISWINAVHGEEHVVNLLSVHILCLIRIETHRGYRGSNPTWTKKVSSETVPLAHLENAKSIVLTKVNAYIENLPETHFKFKAHNACGDVANSQILDDKFDAILTSPPYPNRTDYIRHYLPATELLIGGDENIERQLREDQIGTPLIRKTLPLAKLPYSVSRIIHAIGEHESYASKSYYVKGYQYYFADMDRTLRSFRSLLRSGGLAIIVVQDAYYKNLRIPVADLLIDMAESIGLELKERKDFKVKHALSNLSPLARKSEPKKHIQETCFLLKKG